MSDIEQLQAELTTAREKLDQAQIEISRLREALEIQYNGGSNCYQCQASEQDCFRCEKTEKALSTPTPTDSIMRVVRAAQAWQRARKNCGRYGYNAEVNDLGKAVESLPEGF